MIKFFRSIRQKLLRENKITKYLLYALGEIVLVVLGILIALQINNWNERQKAHSNEVLYLNDLIKSIDTDLKRYDGNFKNRLDRKIIAIDTLMHFIGTKAEVPDSVFLEFFGDTDIDIAFRYDSGPYEAIKSIGLNQISNAALRERIIRTYEVTLPVHLKFSESPGLSYNHSIEALEDQLIETKIQWVNGEWDFVEVPKVPNVLSDPRLAELLHMESIKYANYRRRLVHVKAYLEKLKAKIQEELDKTAD